MKKAKRFGNQEGQGMVEYILIVLLIALVAMTAYATLGNQLQNEVSGASNELETIAGS